MRTHLAAGIVAISTMALAGCGGSGGGGVQSTPAPIVTPPPAPSPPPPPPPPPPAIPPLPPGPIGLQSSAPFATQAGYMDVNGLKSGSDAIQFSYSPSDNSYTIALPGHQAGQLVTTSGVGSFQDGAWTQLAGTSNKISSDPASVLQGFYVVLDWPSSSTLNYTSGGTWSDNGPFPTDHGQFAYGIPTTAADMPVVGAASYAGTVRGLSDQSYFVGGSVSLSFDFAAGTLSGSMKPELMPWDTIPLGTYTFRDTVYSTGSTTFSGAFNVPGSSAPSSFSGNFNGPQAAEFMASWQAPYIDPTTNQSGMMVGVWTGKKN